ncbi:hypothetical protein AU476_13515 [Cupriavidus sp. UYMSc13B]|nr:hypothetical protein AU476_13515 [Cupriavidus sp. UYMSc13B]
MATPSLHVALTAMATWFVARHWPKALWAAIPWTILIWISTVVLAWHYAVDGLAGIAMGSVCIALARQIVRLSQGRWAVSAIRGPQMQQAPAPARDEMLEQQL